MHILLERNCMCDLLDVKPIMNVDAAIKAVLASDKEVSTSSGDSKVLRKKLNKVVLAYSGGLDTSVIVPWLRYVINRLS